MDERLNMAGTVQLVKGGYSHNVNLSLLERSLVRSTEEDPATEMGSVLRSKRDTLRKYVREADIYRKDAGGWGGAGIVFNHSDRDEVSDKLRSLRDIGTLLGAQDISFGAAGYKYDSDTPTRAIEQFRRHVDAAAPYEVESLDLHCRQTGYASERADENLQARLWFRRNGQRSERRFENERCYRWKRDFPGPRMDDAIPSRRKFPEKSNQYPDQVFSYGSTRYAYEEDMDLREPFDRQIEYKVRDSAALIASKDGDAEFVLRGNNVEELEDLAEQVPKYHNSVDVYATLRGPEDIHQPEWTQYLERPPAGFRLE